MQFNSLQPALLVLKTLFTCPSSLENAKSVFCCISISSSIISLNSHTDVRLFIILFVYSFAFTGCILQHVQNDVSRVTCTSLKIHYRLKSMPDRWCSKDRVHNNKSSITKNVGQVKNKDFNFSIICIETRWVMVDCNI